MKYTGILNRDISAMVARTGHFDRIVVCDAGLPIPAGVPCIDLSIGPNVPKVTEVLKMLTLELPIEQFWFANEIQPSWEARSKELLAIMPTAESIPLSHAEFKKLALGAVGFIRTGDYLSWGNVMVASGVAVDFGIWES
ncbi:MAG: D-ribose pyranase [Actinobacteria bacterium]|nr:D-ribose pyranase [Actinomycetota bacterium]